MPGVREDLPQVGRSVGAQKDSRWRQVGKKSSVLPLCKFHFAKKPWHFTAALITKIDFSKYPKSCFVNRYSCDVCAKTLSSSGSLHNHRLTHAQQPFACLVCAKTFRMKQKLTVHMLAHEGRKPFECVDCGVGFVHKQTWSAHMRRCHDGFGKLLDCARCGKKFSDQSYLNRHLRWHERVREDRKKRRRRRSSSCDEGKDEEENGENAS